jgi:adenylate cyclase
MTQTSTRRASLGAGIGLVAAALAWALGALPFMRTVELKTYDLRVRALTDPRKANPDIVIVSIDDASVRKMEPQVGRWPWPRMVHATLIDFLSRAPARVIAYDILFGERDRRSFELQGETWTGEESDRLLSEAVAKAGNVVVSADVTAADPLAKETMVATAQALGRSAMPQSTAFEARPSVMPPFADLASAASSIGHTFLVLDPDGPARMAVPAVRAAGRTIPSLAVATALRALGAPTSSVRLEGDTLQVGPARVPLVDVLVPSADGPPTTHKRMVIRFTGPAIDDTGQPTYREYPFYDLFYSELQLQSGQKPFVDPQVFRNKVVIVGTTAAGLHDVFTVPFAAGKMPGAQVHANVIDDILAQRFMQPGSAPVNLSMLVAAAVLVGVAGLFFGVWWAVAVAMVAALAVAGLSAWQYSAGTWVEVARPLVGVALSLFGVTAYQYFVEGREKRLVKHVFSRFVSRDVFDQLMADPTRARLGGERRDMSVLFSDIRGFTTFTERGRAEDVVAQLNEYFSAMVPAVFAHRGTVDKFVGDMIMALFGAPLDDPDHPDHALQAALAMLATLDTLNAKWATAGMPQLGIGVGINSGDMIAGNIGAESIMSYTAIGDAVNLGSRLESQTKEFGARIIISEATRARLKGRYDMKPLGTVTVKGRSEPVQIFEVRPMVSAQQGV